MLNIDNQSKAAAINLSTDFETAPVGSPPLFEYKHHYNNFIQYC